MSRRAVRRQARGTHRAEDFVAVAVLAAEDADADVGDNVPQSDGVVRGRRKQQARVCRVEPELVDGLAVADVRLDLVERRWPGWPGAAEILIVSGSGSHVRPRGGLPRRQQRANKLQAPHARSPRERAHGKRAAGSLGPRLRT